MLIIIIASLFVFNVLLYYLKVQSKRSTDQSRKDFWEKEIKSNHTPRGDLSDLTYIHIPINELPIVNHPVDKELMVIQNKIIEYSKKPILNLNGQSNTDLKLKYGTANINYLIECDNNYTKLIRTLYEWGLYYYNQHELEHARKILEYAIDCKSDISKNYTLLAHIYTDKDLPEKIDKLIDHASSLKTLMKENILQELKNIKYSSFLS